jgi:predicted NBD/HSP70 family sugar kinase
MNSSEFTAIGVDVGGTKIAAGVVTFPGGIVQARRIIPTLPKRGGEAVLTDVERLVSELAAEARAANQAVEGIGVGVSRLSIMPATSSAPTVLIGLEALCASGLQQLRQR